jgi:predicted amidophosphoribosyltransferase
MANQAEPNVQEEIILALAEEQAAGKLLEAGKLIDQSPSAIKLRLYQTLANIATEKTLPYFSIPKGLYRRRKTKNKTKEKKKEKRKKKNTGTIIHKFLD